MSNPSGPSLDTAAIVSTVLEGVLYGFSLLMYILTVYMICRRRRPSEWNWINLTIANFLLILSTTHLAVDMYRVWLGLIGHASLPGGPMAYFGDVSQMTFVFKNSIYTVQTAIGDGVLIYRSYMVWKPKLWVLTLPMILWCAVIATAIGTVYTISLANPSSGNIFAARTGQWIMAFYATTFSCNLISTMVLGYRLWAIDRSGKNIRSSKSNVLPVLLVIVDAGVLYSAALFTALLCFASGSTAQFILLDLISPIISISFYMVILRIAFVGEGRRTGLTTGSVTGSGIISSASANTRGKYSNHPIPMQVQIQKNTYQQEDSLKDSEL